MDKIAAALAGAFAVAGLLVAPGCERLAGWLQPDRCVLSDRPLHPRMEVRVEVEGDGLSGKGCCVRCAVSYSQQTGKTVRLFSVTDYSSGRPIGPGRAAYVTGSDTAPCVAHGVVTSDGRHECVVGGWDRCAPSSVAFANFEEAREFQRAHGGAIQSFSELVGSAKVVAAQ